MWNSDFQFGRTIFNGRVVNSSDVYSGPGGVTGSGSVNNDPVIDKDKKFDEALKAYQNGTGSINDIIDALDLLGLDYINENGKLSFEYKGVKYEITYVLEQEPVEDEIGADDTSSVGGTGGTGGVDTTGGTEGADDTSSAGGAGGVGGTGGAGGVGETPTYE